MIGNVDGMRKTKEQIIDFFQDFIYGFIYHDIDSCIKVGANYIVALSLLSYTEFIGGLITGNLGLEGNSKKNFNETLKYFPKAYEKAADIKLQYTIGTKIEQEKGLYEIFRCGLAHEYFIKGKNITIVWNNPNGFTARHIGFKKRYGKLIFYNNEYYRDFKNAIQEFYKELIVKEDALKINNFSVALNRLESRKML